ncbi:tRNA (adenine(58)-N(1))-methyltransferase catalytic subunit trm61 [Cladobotryum mycophilum]|uniref:tRNA (adenine(58)-N(1))-methyltransferase catalytic subunit TRM61 n=1 Tax=Cladobotryum mycophilum TaxID=491253 RepID=A0ABR0SNQ8_9HYPO
MTSNSGIESSASITMAKPSAFLEPGLKTSQDTLAIISLSRDTFQPLTLERSTGAVNGYAEGATLNTRFGSYPHSTLLDIPWGSQVRASMVDTGSRGRKRRRDATDEDTPIPSQDEEDSTAATNAPVKKAVTASSGFIYVLRPTPELWTMSLPHRTQVVYTPDYSYILHRIRARPGTRIIEAGAGSGSFTHASVRAVYNGYPKDTDDVKGKVFSFEYNESRYHKMQVEIKDHGLDGLVRLTHRDVYKDGFLLDGKSPKATSVFLDLPAPWEALHHLSRRKLKKGGELDDSDVDWASPLDPKQSVHICTFSPCIEQVTRTVTELRTLGWVDVDMVAISHKRLNVLRDRVGLNYPSGEKGFNQSPVDVTEALSKLRSLAERNRELQRAQAAEADMEIDSTPSAQNQPVNGANGPNGVEEDDEKTWLQGRLVHRPEGELKTHTSYLVFAILPCEWDEESEAAAFARWPCGNEKKTIGNLNKQARKEEKRKMMEGKPKKQKKGSDTQITVPKIEDTIRA